MDSQERAAGVHREWPLAERLKTSLNLHPNLVHVIPYLVPLLVLLAVILIAAPIWEPGYPWGSDTWGHLHRASSMMQSIQEHGWIDGFLKSAWMTDWYMGDPTRVYYPPLTAWILGLLSGLTGDVFVAYRVFVTVVLAGLAGSVYIIGFRWDQNRWAALAGAVLAVTAPYTLRTIFAEGNLPRALLVLMLPWIIWWTESILTKKKIGGRFIALSILWALALTSHVMQAAMFAIIIGLFVVARVMSSVYIPLRRAFLALVPVGLGGVLAAFYLVPAYSHLELANVPYLPASKIDLFSINLNALAPVQSGLESLHIGSLSLLLALGVVVLKGSAVQRVLLTVGLIAIFLAFGNASGVYRVLPLNQMFLPERFLNAASVLIPLAVAAWPASSPRRHTMLIAGLLLVIVIEFIPASRMIHMRPAPVDEYHVATRLAELPLEGRVASLTPPGPTAAQIYLASEIGGKDHVSGWGLENTPHQDAIRRLLAGMERSPDYVQRLLSLWHADYAMTRPETGQTLDKFTPVADTPSLTLWQRDSASSFAQQLPAGNRMLVIGQNATSWLFAFPFASEGYSGDPSAYDAAYLSHYSVIGLNRFKGAGEALAEWVSEGNTLIVDLSGYDPIFETGYTMFGVQALSLMLQGDAALQWSDDFAGMPADFAPDMMPWVGATYRGLDEVIASVQYHGEEYPIIGRKSVGDGSVWYIGFNLLYWLDITGQHDAIAQVVDVLLADTGVDRSITLPPIGIVDLVMQSDFVSFDISLDEPADVILSMTYFPRWLAEIDGEAVLVFDHEHMTGLSLPAGQHTVTMSYHPYSAVSVVGLVVSLFGLGGALSVAYYFYRHPLLAFEDRYGHFFDRHAIHATPPPPEPEAHTTCPACGCERALIGPPTPESYPFVSISCPECGYEM